MTGWINFPLENKRFFFVEEMTVLQLAGFPPLLLMLHRTFKYQSMGLFFEGTEAELVCSVPLANCEGTKRKTDRKEMKVGVLRTMPVDNKKM